METYFRLPDQLVLVSEEHAVDGICEFTLTLRGRIYDYGEAAGKVFWLLEPDLTNIDFDLQPVKLVDDE